MSQETYSVVQEHYDTRMFSALVAEYMDHSGFHNFGYWFADTACHKDASENLMEQLLAMIPVKQGTILDVACGTGATTRHLLKYYPAENVTAINISAKQLEEARRTAPGCTFAQMDATELRFETASFDAVICVEAAFHFNTRAKFLKEALRVLRPGGWLVLTDALVNEAAEAARPGRTAENYLASPEAYDAALREAGFAQAVVRDCTEECWRRFYWHAVNYYHRKLLEKAITVEALEEVLEPTYRRVGDLTYYILAGARKGSA